MRSLALLLLGPLIGLGMLAGVAVGGDSGAGSATVHADGGVAPPAGGVPAPPPDYERIRWRRSRAVGVPWAGRLVRGVRLPAEGHDFFTWDPVRERTPNRRWRRYGHDRLVRTLLAVLRRFRADHPEAPRIGIGDLSRTRGGDFGARFGGLGHGSHQNGLDADLYYPRRDRRERAPARVSQVDRKLSQDLVRRLVRAGAVYVFVGPKVGLRGRRPVVQPLQYHDDHLHVRIRPRKGGR